nr:hypothetical protein [Bifidobacterium miconis]
MVRVEPVAPFAHVVAQHVLAMRRGHDHAVFGGLARVDRSAVIVRGRVERGGALVHGWPQHVQLQSQRQFEDVTVEIHVRSAVFGRILGLRPVDRAFFVVDEETTIAYARTGFDDTVGRKVRCDVAAASAASSTERASSTRRGVVPESVHIGKETVDDVAME